MSVASIEARSSPSASSSRTAIVYGLFSEAQPADQTRHFRARLAECIEIRLESAPGLGLR